MAPENNNSTPSAPAPNAQDLSAEAESSEKGPDTPKDPLELIASEELDPDGLEDDPLGSVSRSALHFFWLADCSGSMSVQGKMQAVNNAIHECIPATREANASNAFADMLVRAIKFSNGAQWHVEEPSNVDDFEWQDLEAYGKTDLGAAIRLLASELTPEKMGRRALPPVIVLLSDGTPTDSWEQELNTFNSTGWGHPGRTVRIAIAIGHDANKEILAQFTGNPETVFEAKNAQRLTDLIKWASVTLSKFASSGASQVDLKPGQGPMLPPPPPIPEELDDEFELW